MVFVDRVSSDVRLSVGFGLAFVEHPVAVRTKPNRALWVGKYGFERLAVVWCTSHGYEFHFTRVAHFLHAFFWRWFGLCCTFDRWLGQVGHVVNV